MAALRLRLRARPPCLVDASPLVPELLAGKSAGDIERVQLQGWNEAFAVGELFRITGDDAVDLSDICRQDDLPLVHSEYNGIITAFFNRL